jgi:hypothetical protein
MGFPADGGRRHLPFENGYFQTSRLETPEELQLRHNQVEFLFLTVLLLFAQYKMHYW